MVKRCIYVKKKIDRLWDWINILLSGTLLNWSKLYKNLTFKFQPLKKRFSLLKRTKCLASLSALIFTHWSASLFSKLLALSQNVSTNIGCKMNENDGFLDLGTEGAEMGKAWKWWQQGVVSALTQGREEDSGLRGTLAGTEGSRRGAGSFVGRGGPPLLASDFHL